MPYVDNVPHAGSAELLFTGMYDELAGTVARTMPRVVATGSTLTTFATTGTVAVRAIPLPAGLVVTNIAIIFGNTSANGPTHFWLGLTDAQLNVLAVSADQGAAAQTVNTVQKLALTTPFQVQYTGLYYVAASSTAGTTAPTCLGGGTSGGGFAPAPILCGTAGTQTTPPAVGSQLASGTITVAGNSNFAAWLS